VARAAGRGHGLLAEADNVDILATDAVYGVQPGSQRGSVIAHTDGDPDSAAYSYYFRDRLGTPQVIRDGSKVLTGRQQTSPYGVPMVSAGIPVVVGYTGHKWDQELDSFYAPYRYYNPWNARWSVRDPIGILDGPNRYLYAKGCPIRLFDPMGLFNVPSFFCSCICGGATLAGVSCACGPTPPAWVGWAAVLLCAVVCSIEPSDIPDLTPPVPCPGCPPVFPVFGP
jgi:RHS repeat-associated protein